jgi:hypothetical protein
MSVGMYLSSPLNIKFNRPSNRPRRDAASFWYPPGKRETESDRSDDIRDVPVVRFTLAANPSTARSARWALNVHIDCNWSGRDKLRLLGQSLDLAGGGCGLKSENADSCECQTNGIQPPQSLGVDQTLTFEYVNIPQVRLPCLFFVTRSERSLRTYTQSGLQ